LTILVTVAFYIVVSEVGLIDVYFLVNININVV